MAAVNGTLSVSIWVLFIPSVVTVSGSPSGSLVPVLVSASSVSGSKFSRGRKRVMRVWALGLDSGKPVKESEISTSFSG